MLIKISKHSFFLTSVAFVFILYMVNRPLVTLDSYWVIPTTLSLLNEGNINLDEFSAYGVGNSYAAIQIDNHFYNYFPYGISFLIIPIVAILNIFIPESFFFQYHGQIEKFCASLLILSSFFFLYNVFLFYISKKISAFLVVVMGLCTPLFTSGSRALWQHPGSVLLLSISLFLLVSLMKRNVRAVPLLGITLALSYVVRPTNAIPFLLISLFVVYYFQEQKWKYIAYSVATLILYAIVNYFNFGDFLPPYYRSSRLTFDWDVFKIAFLGNMFSPNRGLFVWSPVLLVFILSIFVAKKERPIILLSLLIIIFHFIAISLFPHWWGGHSVGPRFTTDIIPFFGLVLCLVWKHFQSNRVFFVSFLMLVVISFAVQISAVISKKTQLWNIRGSDINEKPERVWDWNQPQFYPFE